MGWMIIEKYEADAGSIACRILCIEDGLPMPPEVFIEAKKYLERYVSRFQADQQLKIKNTLNVIPTLLH